MFISTRGGIQPWNCKPADWVKKRIRLYEKWKNKLHAEMLEGLKKSHQWTHNISPPSKPKHYDPNELPSIPLSEFLDD